MTIRIELPEFRTSPSQGRNPGSIPGGSASAFPYTELLNSLPGLAQDVLVPGRHYRAWIDDDAAKPEFVFFVGFGSSGEFAVFEDGDGDLHRFYSDKVSFE